MTVSIALCTYNGEKFLEEQLESFTHQTRFPDEIVICDDHSTDMTIQIVESFQKSAPFDVRIYINPSRLGSTKNFERAISLSMGDVIFLSDQDDWWYPEKISTILKCFEGKNRGKYGELFSDAEIVDETLNFQNRNLWESIGFDKKIRTNFAKGNAISILLKNNIVTGATMAFDANYKDLLLPIPEVWVHDAWISLLLAYTSNLHMIEQSLIKYRRHGFQQIGVRRPSFPRKVEKAIKNKGDFYFHEAEQFKLLYERLLENQSKIIDPSLLELLREKINHLETRAHMRNYDMSRIAIPMKELISGRYHKYSLGWNSFFKDLFIGH
jgi:glycosyltransferase involved in cell wall biosynthesis